MALTWILFCQTLDVRMNEFWDLVEQARADAAGSGVAWPSGSAIGAALVERLAPLPLEQIVEFHCRFMQAARRLYEQMGFERCPEFDISAADMGLGDGAEGVRIIAYRLDLAVA